MRVEQPHGTRGEQPRTHRVRCIQHFLLRDELHVHVEKGDIQRLLRLYQKLLRVVCCEFTHLFLRQHVAQVRDCDEARCVRQQASPVHPSQGYTPRTVNAHLA